MIVVYPLANEFSNFNFNFQFKLNVKLLSFYEIKMINFKTNSSILYYLCMLKL